MAILNERGEAAGGVFFVVLAGQQDLRFRLLARRTAEPVSNFILRDVHFLEYDGGCVEKHAEPVKGTGPFTWKNGIKVAPMYQMTAKTGKNIKIHVGDQANSYLLETIKVGRVGGWMLCHQLRLLHGPRQRVMVICPRRTITMSFFSLSYIEDACPRSRDHCMKSCVVLALLISLNERDQDRAVWQEQRNNKSIKNFEMIVDDGGHENQQILTSFHYLWSVVAPNGIYVIEDMAGGAYGFYDSQGDGKMGKLGGEIPGSAQYEVLQRVERMLARGTHPDASVIECQ